MQAPQGSIIAKRLNRSGDDIVLYDLVAGHEAGKYGIWNQSRGQWVATGYAPEHLAEAKSAFAEL